MASIRVKGFKIFKDRHGKQRCYHRLTSMSVDLVQHPIGTAGFFAECSRIAAITKAAGTAKPGTLGLLIHQYKKSPAWQDLKPASMEWYEDALEYLKPINDIPLSKFNRPFVVRIRDKAQEKNSWYFANKVKATLSSIFSWGVERGYMPINPAKEIRKISRPKGLAQANRPWTDQERFLVLDEAPWHLKVPIAIMMHTGMDPCDAVRLMKTQYDGKVINYNRQKTGNSAYKPAPDELQKVLRAAPKHDAVTVAANSYGNPWTVDGLNSTWMKFKSRLEEEGSVEKGLTLKGLRHTQATILRELGFDHRTIADVLGQNTEAMAQHYSRNADTRANIEKITKKYNASERLKRANFVKPTKKTVKPKG